MSQKASRNEAWVCEGELTRVSSLEVSYLNKVADGVVARQSRDRSSTTPLA